MKKAIAALLLLMAAMAANAETQTGKIALIATIDGQPAMRSVYWYVDGLLVTTKHSDVYTADAMTHIVRCRIGSVSYARNISVMPNATSMAVFDMTEAVKQ